MSALRRKSDEEGELSLVRRIADGDRGAFELIYQNYHKRVFVFVVRMVKDTAMAEDVAADVLFEVWKGAARFRARSKVSTWIFGIARNTALNALRRRAPETADLGEVVQMADSDPTPEQSAGEGEVREKVRKALSFLSGDHREIVELVLGQGLSYQEIAEIADCPVNTVKTRMFYARRALREILTRTGIGQLYEVKKS